ncbi:hypothetical protein M0R45_013035 [Rubus argutus]|uniref:Uncharacterized protein n=1 Tax=Rubus argutus TaxID=59490 RepID=A0AAW1XJZ3_RUBAR
MSLTPISLFTLSLLLLLLLPFTATSSLHNLLQSQGLPAGSSPTPSSPTILTRWAASRFIWTLLAWPSSRTGSTSTTTVRANLSFGGLKGLEGLIQEELFLWLPVKGISVSDPSSGLILFDIGVAHKQLSLSLFEDPPLCNPQGVSVKEDVVKSNELQAQR